jgi:hypothetical protein
MQLLVYITRTPALLSWANTFQRTLLIFHKKSQWICLSRSVCSSSCFSWPQVTLPTEWNSLRYQLVILLKSYERIDFDVFCQCRWPGASTGSIGEGVPDAEPQVPGAVRARLLLRKRLRDRARAPRGFHRRQVRSCSRSRLLLHQEVLDAPWFPHTCTLPCILVVCTRILCFFGSQHIAPSVPQEIQF